MIRLPRKSPETTLYALALRSRTASSSVSGLSLIWQRAKKESAATLTKLSKKVVSSCSSSTAWSRAFQAFKRVKSRIVPSVLLGQYFSHANWLFSLGGRWSG